MSPNSTVRIISECFVKPQHSLQESKHPFHLTSWDLANIHPGLIIEKGLVFPKQTPPNQPQDDQQQHDEYFMKNLLDRLKNSLSLALVHFYPLTGRLAIVKNENNPLLYSLHVDCTNPRGAKFVHATANLTVSDILSPVDYGPAHVIQSFFEDDMTMDDLHTMSLLSIRVTELVDGVVIACCMSHAIADGNSFWHFFNMLSEIFITGNSNISRPPILKRWFPDGHGPIINLSSTVLSSRKSSSSSLLKSSPQACRVRIFQISSEAIAKLKAKANAEYSSSTDTNSKLNISSFQSLSALVWRSITRARNLPPDQTIACFFPVNNRAKLEPPLSQDYFGNSVSVESAVTSVGELLENSHGWAAWKLHQTVANYNDKAVRQGVDEWFKSPEIRYPPDVSIPELNNLMAMNDFLTFNMCGIEFGMGKPQGIVSGRKTAIGGYVTAYRGRDYDQVGNIDLEVCLWPHIMSKLEADKEFMEALC